jgi:hypothetical protein
METSAGIEATEMVDREVWKIGRRRIGRRRIGRIGRIGRI